MFEVLFALLPMVILIIAMGICKWPGDKSSLLTLVITVMLATFAFGIPTREIGFTLINSTARACITILSVIWMAVFSYNILLDSGKIEVLKDQLATISTDRSVQVLLITWGFGGLLEGMAGYGTSVAIPAAILVTLGFRPLFAVLVSLIANSEPTTFGAVGIAETVLMEETGCPLPELCKATIQQLYPFIFLIPITLAILADSRRQFKNPAFRQAPICAGQNTDSKHTRVRRSHLCQRRQYVSHSQIGRYRRVQGDQQFQQRHLRRNVHRGVPPRRRPVSDGEIRQPLREGRVRQTRQLQSAPRADGLACRHHSGYGNSEVLHQKEYDDVKRHRLNKPFPQISCHISS